jgi:hypothetical protein
MSRLGQALAVGPGAWSGCIKTVAKPQRIREIKAISFVDQRKLVEGVTSWMMRG